MERGKDSSDGNRKPPKLKKHALHGIAIACRYADRDGIFYLSKEGVALTVGMNASYQAIKWAMDHTLTDRGIVKQISPGTDWRKTRAGQRGQGPRYQLLVPKDEAAKLLPPHSVPCSHSEISLRRSIREIQSYLADIIGEVPVLKRQGGRERLWFNKPEHIGFQKPSDGRHCCSRGVRTWVVYDRKEGTTVSLREYLQATYGIQDLRSQDQIDQYQRTKAVLDLERSEVWAARDAYRSKHRSSVPVIKSPPTAEIFRLRSHGKAINSNNTPCSISEVFQHRYRYEPPDFIVNKVVDRMQHALEFLSSIDPEAGNRFINSRYADPIYREKAAQLYYSIRNKKNFYHALGYVYDRKHHGYYSFDGTKKVVMPRDKCIATPLTDPATGLHIGFEVRSLATDQKVQVRCPEYHECKVVTGFLTLDQSKPVLLIESASDTVVTPNAMGTCGHDNLKAVARILNSQGLQVIIAADSDVPHRAWLDAYPHYRWTSTKFKDFCTVTAAGYNWDEFLVLSTPDRQIRAAA